MKLFPDMQVKEMLTRLLLAVTFFTVMAGASLAVDDEAIASAKPHAKLSAFGFFSDLAEQVPAA
ncbi:MAG: hypothetical protein WCY02_08660, partial [Parvibaculum sp.]